MNLHAPPFPEIPLTVGEDSPLPVSGSALIEFSQQWPAMWPLYRKVLLELFSQYETEDLFGRNQTRVAIEKLRPQKRVNYGADLLVRFSFDDTGSTWDFFQKGTKIVHAQPAF